MTLKEAQSWCRRYADSKIENFEVISLFLPRARQNEYLALYAFARGADDRADEPLHARRGVDPARAHVEALAEWRMYLDELYDGQIPVHPAFIALRPVIERHDIEKELFDRMIRAFEQDQQKKRYSTWSEVLDYTHGSADPVGRWVLRLHDHHDSSLDTLSDAICTGLQLVNFLQDIRSDFVARDRIYLPKQEMELFDVTEADFAEPSTPPRLRRFLAWQAARAERYLEQGKPLILLVHPSLRKQLSLFHGGGRLALQALKRAHYNVAARATQVTPLHRIALLSLVLRGRTL